VTTRRTFLELSAKLATLGCVLGRSSTAFAASAAGLPASNPHLTYGVQMFMVRALAQKDLAAAFQAIRTAGFHHVELYPIAYHQPAAQLRKLLADTGLTAVSGHFDYTARATSVGYAHDLGLKYLVCPMLPEDQKLSLDGFRKAALHFSQWGEEAKQAGLQFVFHNHDYEFKPIDQSNGWTVLMSGTDASLVKLELDLFWLATGGQNPAAMLKQHADRTVLIHLKDRAAGAPNSFVVDSKATSYCTELGTGTIDWPSLLQQARSQGIRYAYLDQDDTRLSVQASMSTSRAYLTKLNL
jgi:sugar phosphate isomerase/epimerase